VVGLCVLWSGSPTLAAGVFVDAAGEVAFLTAPQARALSGRLFRSNGETADATLYILDATFAINSGSLVEVDIPFVSFLDTTEVVTGFSDLTIRARTRLYHSPGRTLRLIAGLRTGTGTTRVWPYSSRSFDLEAGIAYVDTLSMFHLWASASGAYVGQQPKNDVAENERHDHYGRVTAGLKFPFGRGASILGLGVMAGFFEGGRSRELLLATFDHRRSEWLSFTLAAHVEGGNQEERVSNYAVGAGVRVFY
jgi:hypothetical protein